jgi:hypothetical protein
MTKEGEKTEPQTLLWSLSPRELSEYDKLNAKLADVSETEARLLSTQELDELAEMSWMITASSSIYLGS